MSDPLGALSEGAATPPHKSQRDPSVSAPSEVFRRRLLATRTQSLIVNPNDGSTPLPPTPAPPPPPPPPEYAPPSPPRRGTVQGYPGGKAPIGLVASSDGGRAVSQLIPTATAPSAPKSFAAAAAAVEQRLLHKSLNGSGGNGDPQNGGVTSPLRHSIGYRPRQASTDASGKPACRQ